MDKEKEMQKLSEEIEKCKKCGLWKTRRKALTGDGNTEADIMVIGESPGYHEDIQNKAFVGEAGKVLDRLLKSVGLDREKIYITNVLKCHPPRNHNPNREQIEACKPYLWRQIEIIQPKLIITLGKFSTREIFERYAREFIGISKVKGKVCQAKEKYGTIKIVPQYHPAFGCYHSEKIPMLEKDFSIVANVIGGISGSKRKSDLSSYF